MVSFHARVTLCPRFLFDQWPTLKNALACGGGFGQKPLMAFTATKDLMLPATVTGSWPRPRWYTMNTWGRPLDTAMMDPWFSEQFTHAHAIVVSDQTRAGLDVVTTGDYHLDEDVAGRSWHHYMLQRWKGFEHEELQPKSTSSRHLLYPAGTMLDSIYKTWRWPRVVGKVEHAPKTPLE